MSSGSASPWSVIRFFFSAFILLVGRQEGHTVGKKAGCWFVGGDHMTGKLCASFSSSCHHSPRTSIILNSNKIQNADILLPSYPDCHGKRPLNIRCTLRTDQQPLSLLPPDGAGMRQRTVDTLVPECARLVSRVR